MRNRKKQLSKINTILIRHKGKVISTTVGSKPYERLFCGTNPAALRGHRTGNIPYGFAHRPDLISNLFYNSPNAWWRICEVNNIFDVFEQLNSGDQIFLP
jgi:hypothetical protein